MKPLPYCHVSVCQKCRQVLVFEDDAPKHCLQDGYAMIDVARWVPCVAIQSLLRGDNLRDELNGKICELLDPLADVIGHND